MHVRVNMSCILFFLHNSTFIAVMIPVVLAARYVFGASFLTFYTRSSVYHKLLQ